ncbi:hypothetical protein R1sor_017404 [Riccia sorocarpa]|uniref:Reverse transcriptase domain-containing protein n=1 Tax=Riccia sorocarpa TaxID=122646 RepID=A0ABD3I9J1_9MARC
MNEVFRDLLDESVIVYLDDIIIFSPTWEQHLKDVEEVFKRLAANQLYLKKSKCSFGQECVVFLGNLIDAEGIHPNKTKVKALVDWHVPRSASELRSFLGLASCFRRFIFRFAHKAAPLFRLIRKAQKYVWNPPAERAFQALKSALTEAPVLALPKLGEPFEVHTDASAMAIGGVLMQYGHPVAYESHKFNDSEVKWPSHEQEMYAVIHCLKYWEFYLLPSKNTHEELLDRIRQRLPEDPQAQQWAEQFTRDRGLPKDKMPTWEDDRSLVFAALGDLGMAQQVHVAASVNGVKYYRTNPVERDWIALELVDEKIRKLAT